MASSQGKNPRGDQSPEGTLQPQASSDCGKNLAQRKALFSNLDEAFKKIRSKPVSNDNPSKKGLQESASNPDKSEEKSLNSASGDQSAEETTTKSQDAEHPPDTSVAGRSLADFHGGSSNPTQAKEIDMPFTEQETRESTAVEELDDSVNTVDDIIDQYAGHPTNGTSVPPRDGVATRLGFRGEETHRYGNALRHYPPGSPPSDLPQSPCMETPLSRRRSRSMLEFNQVSSPFAGSTVSDSRRLLDADAQENELQQARKPFFPSPLRLPEKCVKKKPNIEDNDDFFVAGSSFHDTTADSTADPFKYDAPQRKASGRPLKEREVSRALKRVSHIGDSGPMRFTPEASTCAVGYQRSRRSLDDTNPVTRDAKVIRVVIRDRPKRGVQEGGYRDTVNRSTKNVRPSNSPNESFDRESTGDGDWVTELTGEDESEAEEGNQRPTTLQLMGNGGADATDNGERKSSSLFGSRFRVLQHPAGKDNAESYELRDLKGSKQQVFLPKPRPVLGAENSVRLFPTSNSTLNQVRPPMSRKLSNPFGGKDSYKRADAEGNFARGGRFGRSKYEFRDSAASEYAFAIPHSKTQGAFSEPEPSSLEEGEGNSLEVEFEPTPEKKSEIRLVDKHYPNRTGAAWWRAEREEARVAASSSRRLHGGSFGAESKFKFDLLPLDEAQRQQKWLRETGQKDDTDGMEGQLPQSKSGMQSGALHTSASGAPQLPPLHTRRGVVAPKLSLNLSGSLDESYRQALQELSMPFSATTEPQITPVSARTTKGLLTECSPSSTAPAETPKEKKRFLGRFKSRLFTSKNRGHRNVSNATVIRHPVVNQSGLSLAAMEELVEPGIPEAAHKRRRQWFAFMATLGILFPFIAVAVIAGKLNASLEWYTKGEIHCLTIRQRNFIRNVFLFQCCLYTIVVSCIIAVFTKTSY
ncbi:hypothetical protein F5Y06DRAFT_303278 [Hypoxylon sp. FL0890]|nr:hypothetical protein F5Y06DRAFT_303278 [Hypoxylon sp. FL0890]